MPYLTENQLAATLDIPIALPSTELRQGDWLVIATTKVVTPMRLRFRYLSLSLLSCTVNTSLISNSNRIYGNLGFVYIALRKDYSGESPGSADAQDIVSVTALGTYNRPDTELVLDAEGAYSWIIANNMRANASSSIPTDTDINFRVAVTGMARLEME